MKGVGHALHAASAADAVLAEAAVDAGAVVALDLRVLKAHKVKQDLRVRWVLKVQ